MITPNTSQREQSEKNQIQNPKELNRQRKGRKRGKRETKAEGVELEVTGDGAGVVNALHLQEGGRGKREGRERGEGGEG